MVIEVIQVNICKLLLNCPVENQLAPVYLIFYISTLNSLKLVFIPDVKFDGHRYSGQGVFIW